MYRIQKISSLINRNARTVLCFQAPSLTILNSRKNASELTNFRFSSNKCNDEKPVPECKPKKQNVCPPLKECDTKQMPYINECSKPNLMSECPKPDCPYDEKCKKSNRSLILVALMLAAATLGALYYYLSQTQPPSGPPPPIIQKKKKERVCVKVPKDAKDIPKQVPYLLIGGGTAAFAAFRAIKSNDPTAKVLVISNEEFYPYMRPPLSKELWFSDDEEAVKKLNFKQWNGTERSLYYEPNDFYINVPDLMVSENGGVAVARGWCITHLDVLNKEAYLNDGSKIKYEKCLIATGSVPNQLDILENADKKVLNRTVVFRGIYDFQCLKERLAEAKSIAIIGGGFLGSELACAFGRRAKTDSGFVVHQIFKESGHMGAILPEYLSFWTTEKVKEEGVKVYPNSEITGVTATDENVSLTLNSGQCVTADLVLVAVGASPNTSMAEKSDLETDPDLGGYLVNTELQARTDLYVAGDAACFYDPKLGRRRIEHHDNAVISGRLAGENMTGAAKPYVHQSMFWSDLGPDIGYEAIGIVDSTLPTVGVFAKSQSQSTQGSKKEEDCSKHQVAEDGEKKLTDEEKRRNAELKRQLAAQRPGEDFTKGVIFYLRDDVIVGIVLWNVFNRMSTARQVLKDQCKYDDLNEVAKLFNIHED